MLPDTIYNIYGFLSAAEAELLYRLASEVDADGHIIEIGSFQGRSTVCLGLGAKQAGAWVWAIDPHEDYQANVETHYGMENHAALLKNLVDFGVADRVRVVALRSNRVFSVWFSPVALAWIDGSHVYQDVLKDLVLWSVYARKIAMHDTSGHYPEVTQAMNDFLARGGWKITEQVDAITVLEKLQYKERLK